MQNILPAKCHRILIIAGIDDFLCKPLQEGQLLDAISRLLQLPQDPDMPVPAPSSPPTHDAPLDASMLAVLSEAQRDALRIAVEELNRVKVNTVLADVATTHPALARQIHHLADRFCYKELWELLATP